MNNVFELKTGQRRPASSYEAFAAKIKRAKALRASFDQRAVFSIEDQERVAANLHRILEHLNEDRGLPKRQIAQKSGLGGSGDVDSTKRLDPYTLPEGASESRVRRLAKKPGKYFEIAEAIARILEEPMEGYVCQIFEGCSFGTGREFEPDWEDEGWVRLANLLRRMAAAVIRDEDMSRYWLDVVKLNGCYDIKTGHLHQSNTALDSVGCETGLAGWNSVPDELPPIPSVLIGQRLMMEPHEDILVLKGGRQIEAEFSLYLEARLALAPVNQDGLPGPMIEFRSRLDAFSETEGRIVFDNMHSDGSGGSDTIRSALINGVEVEIAEFPLLDVPEAEWREDSLEHVYFAWREVSSALLRSLFGEIERPFDITFREREVYVQEMPPSRFPHGSAGFYLNAYLLTGELEKDLAAACRDCADKVVLFRNSLGQRIDEVEAEAEMRWTRGPEA